MTLQSTSVHLHVSDVKICVTYTSKTKKQHIYTSIIFLSPQEKADNVNFKSAVSLHVNGVWVEFLQALCWHPSPLLWGEQLISGLNCSRNEHKAPALAELLSGSDRTEWSKTGTRKLTHPSTILLLTSAIFVMMTESLSCELESHNISKWKQWNIYNWNIVVFFFPIGQFTMFNIFEQQWMNFSLTTLYHHNITLQCYKYINGIIDVDTAYKFPLIVLHNNIKSCLIWQYRVPIRNSVFKEE